MRSSSIIMFGIFSAILLIFSCIVLQAPKLYSEFELNRCSVAMPVDSSFQQSIILRDRI